MKKKFMINLFFALVLMLGILTPGDPALAVGGLTLSDVYVEDSILNLKFSGLTEENKGSIEVLLDGNRKDNSFVYNVKIPTKLTVSYNNGTKDVSETYNINNDNYVYKGSYKIEPLKLSYVYVEDGQVYASFSGLKPSNMLKIKTTVNNEVAKEGFFSGIKLPIPSTIKYEYNGESKTFNVKLYNEVLYGAENIPIAIKDRLNEKSKGKVESFDGFINVVKGEYGKKINLYDVFSDYIKELYEKYNKEDIIIKSSDVAVDKNFDIALDKEGLIEIQISHSFYNKDSHLAYIYVDNGSIKYTNIREVLNKNTGLVEGDEISLIDLLDFDLIKPNYEPNTEYLIAKDNSTQLPIGLTEKIELKDDTVYNFEILDVLNNDRYSMVFSKHKPIETQKVAFTDVTSKHWAYHTIKNLALNSKIEGFPDGSFKPNKGITVREFNVMLSRAMLDLDPQVIKPQISPISLRIKENDWGFAENMAILSRLDSNELKSFSYSNLDRQITRAEVALLIDKNIEIEDLFSPISPTIKLSDVDRSKYKDSIINLSEYGIIKGYPNGTFQGSKTITRAEICAILERIIISDWNANIVRPPLATYKWVAR